MIESKINLFQFLDVYKNEVVSSQFIVSVMEQDKRFAALFFKYIGCVDFIDVEDAIINVEKTLKEYGRADIWIRGENKSENRRIIIENKLFAGDQWKQLSRYRKYLNQKGREGFLYYLTLEGKPASIGSSRSCKDCDMNSDNARKGYKIISYHTEIKNWLEEVKEISEDGFLNMMINHYLEIIEEHTKIFKLVNDGTELGSVPHHQRNDFGIALELHFWNKLASHTYDSELSINPRRRYAYDKIKKHHSNKHKKAYGIISGNMRIQVGRKKDASCLIFKKGSFNESDVWTNDTEWEEKYFPEYDLTKLNQKGQAEEWAKEVFKEFTTF